VIADPGSSRARRLVSLGIACFLSWQAVGILPAIKLAPACCCLRMQAEKKRCPVCAHAKELESGQPLLETCPMNGATSIPLALVSPVLPGPVAERAPAPARQPLPEDDAPALALAPAPEVPTPPPLA
jgi:hypothetical protein